MNIRILEELGLDQVTMEPGAVLIKEGVHTPNVYVLTSGRVVLKTQDRQIAAVESAGTIFGEISALLGTAPVATVTAAESSTFYVITDFMNFIRAHPDACVSVAQVLACRLVNMNNHFVHIRSEIGKLQENLDSYLPVFPENPSMKGTVA